MIPGGSVAISPGSPATLTPPPGAVTGVQLVNTSYFVVDVDIGVMVGQLAPLGFRTFAILGQGQSVVLSPEANAGFVGTGKVLVYWLTAGDQPGLPGDYAAPPVGFTQIGTITPGTNTVTVTPGPGSTAIIVTGVSSSSTLTALGATTGVALPVGVAQGQWVCGLPGGAGDTSFVITISATQAGTVTIWQTTGTSIVFNLPASGGGMQNPMTALGDLICGAAGGTPSRVAIGATNSLVYANAGTTPAWLPPSAFPAVGIPLLNQVVGNMEITTTAQTTVASLGGAEAGLYRVGGYLRVPSGSSATVTFEVQTEDETGAQTFYFCGVYSGGSAPVEVKATNMTPSSLACFPMVLRIVGGGYIVISVTSTVANFVWASASIEQLSTW